MNVNLFNYYTNHLLKDEKSAQCKTIRSVLLSENNDMQKFATIISIFKEDKTLESDSFTLLNKGIRGHYGGEGNVFEMSLREESDFWFKMHQLFPNNAHLTVTTADAAYLANADISIYGSLFISLEFQHTKLVRRLVLSY